MILRQASEASSCSLTLVAPAKINFHLEILGLRKDQFHELAMLMQSIDLCDRLHFQKRVDGQIRLGCDIDGLSVGDENLIVRAAYLLRKKSGVENLGADIQLEKKIPIGAGLAGGSSDAAAALKGLNALWNLGLHKETLEELAAELGSDVPFCLSGGSQLCFGRGERLEPVFLGSSSIAVLLVKNPLVSVSTPWAYGRFKDLNRDSYLHAEDDFEDRRQRLREQPWLNPINLNHPLPLRNDLQKVVSAEVPSIRKALEILSNLPGVRGVAMSGSGPSCFALFADLESAIAAKEKNRFKFSSAGLECWCCSLLTEEARVKR